MRRAVAVLQAREQYDDVAAYGCSRYGKTAVWLAAKAPEITGLYLQSAGPGGAAVSSLTGIGGETLLALTTPASPKGGGWAAWYRSGLYDAVPDLMRSQGFLDFDTLVLGLAHQRGLRIWIVSYWVSAPRLTHRQKTCRREVQKWVRSRVFDECRLDSTRLNRPPAGNAPNDAWNNPLGARALYESVRRYTSNVGIDQRTPPRVRLLEAVGRFPHDRSYLGANSTQRREAMLRYVAFLADPAANTDAFAAECSGARRSQVDAWLRGE
eukprot:7196444-Prymnesium_polylepis.1